MGAISDARNQSNDNPFQQMRRDLHKMRSQIEKVLPEHVTVDRIERITLNEIRRNPKLLQCDRNSLFGAVMQCATTGLEPGPLGHAYLIPFKGKVQWIAGYKGLIDLAFRSGNLSNVYAMVVRESDKFDFQFGTNGFIEHRPNLRAPADEPIIAAYSVAELETGGTQFELMPAAEINRIRDEKSESSGNSWSPWQTDYNEMAKKTVFRRMSKWLPVSIEHRDAWQSVHGHDEQIIEMDDNATVKSRSTSKRRQSPQQLEQQESDEQVFDDEPAAEPQRQPARREQQRPQQQRPQQRRHPNAPPQQPEPQRQRQQPEPQGRNLGGPGIDVPAATIESIANSQNNYSDSQAWKQANRSLSATTSSKYSRLDDDAKGTFREALGHKYGVPSHEHIPPAWLKREIAFLQDTGYGDADDGGMSERDEYLTSVIDYYHE